jgi:selenide,water dikinase
VLTTAIKQGKLDAVAIEQVTGVMAELNRDASEAMIAVGAHACTDVTGFGLLGHLHSMALASGTAADLTASLIPVLPGVRQLVADGVVPGGTRTNEEFAAQFVTWNQDVSVVDRTVLADAQTSGGLLIAVGPAQVDELIGRLEGARTLAAAQIGTLSVGDPGRIVVRP